MLIRHVSIFYCTGGAGEHGGAERGGRPQQPAAGRGDTAGGQQVQGPQLRRATCAWIPARGPLLPAAADLIGWAFLLGDVARPAAPIR